MNCCRICMSFGRKLVGHLFKYKLSGNYAEMLTAVANVKVSVDDGLPDKLCNQCCIGLEKAYLLKISAERTDKKLRKEIERTQRNAPKKKISFNSIKDVKKEIDELAIKTEPKWEVDVDFLEEDEKPLNDLNNVVIADTLIKKVDGNISKSDDFFVSEADVTWRKTSQDNDDTVEYLDDFFFGDDDDGEYLPPITKSKKSSKKHKQKQTMTSVIKRVNVLPTKKSKSSVIKLKDANGLTSLVTCYPVKRNGSKGSPILLKRPKDLTNKQESRTVRATIIDGKKTKESKVTMIRGAMKQKEKMVCPICGILTFTLNNHMTTHEEKKKFTCEACPKTFANKSNLLSHMKYHSGIRDYICAICGASFYLQKGLIRHQLIHKGERPYGCTLCTKRFIARCDLNRHMKIHSGYKPYKCGTCLMSFNAKHQLQNHERRHTGERPYTCQVCNVAFTYKVNLNNHVMKSHGINLKFKSVHTVTEEFLNQETEMRQEDQIAINNILPHMQSQNAQAIM